MESSWGHVSVFLGQSSLSGKWGDAICPGPCLGVLSWLVEGHEGSLVYGECRSVCPGAPGRV